MPPQLRGDYFHQFLNWHRAICFQPLFELTGRLEFLPCSDTLHPENASTSRPATKMRQPQKVERLGPLFPILSLPLSQWTKLKNLGFLSRHFESKLGKPTIQFIPKSFGIALDLKAHHESESRGGIPPPRALRTGRETLASSGSYCPAAGLTPSCHSANSPPFLCAIPAPTNGRQPALGVETAYISSLPIGPTCRLGAAEPKHTSTDRTDRSNSSSPARTGLSVSPDLPASDCFGYLQAANP